MERKSLYRENYPGYMGHIPMKMEVIGKTVGATNKFIKAYYTKEPDYHQTFIPSINKDYTYYNNDYFNEEVARGYPLEEDKIYSNRSKEARTWINGNKHQLYPEHIPGYTGHVSGIEPAGKKGSPIFGYTYGKATSIAIKGNYDKDIDIPPEERYTSTQKASYTTPKTRSYEEMLDLQRQNDNEKLALKSKKYFSQLTSKQQDNNSQYLEGLSDKYKNSTNVEKKMITEVPYILGYKGFRRGVTSGNYYGKNFQEVALSSINNVLA